jgi:hypothetical protein
MTLSIGSYRCGYSRDRGGKQKRQAALARIRKKMRSEVEKAGKESDSEREKMERAVMELRNKNTY